MSRKRAVIGVAALGVVAAAVAALFIPVVRAAPEIVALLLTASPSSLPVPVSGVSGKQVADTWDAPRSGGRHHRGIDIFAPRGTPILSATEGVIVTVGTNSLGGRIVRVMGPGGYWHYYAHLETYGQVAPWQHVSAGYVLGTVGDSGNARGTPTHLHYGIYRLRGGAINPYPLLKAKSGGA
jgi:murein DD-endopeptidase MepM/ murein hydrolase activator NlpD